MAANASVPEPYTSTGLDGSGGLSSIERSETLTGSDRTAASSLKVCGTSNSWLSWAQKRSACAPAAPAQLPRWMATGRSPLEKLRHHG